jgi:hypothetical protein
MLRGKAFGYWLLAVGWLTRVFEPLRGKAVGLWHPTPTLPIREGDVKNRNSC